MSRIKVTPIYGNGWFGPAKSGHIEVPPAFDAEDIFDDGVKVLSVIHDEGHFDGMIMERSKTFAESENNYTPYSVSLFPPGSLEGQQIKDGINPDYQGYVLISVS